MLNPSSSPTTPPTSQSSSDPDDGRICERVDTGAQPVIPRVLIVSDRSGSMGSNRSWEPSVSAMGRVTAELEDEIDFGLLMFPDVETAKSGSNQNQCDVGDANVSVGPARAAAIAEALEQASPGGQTPTAGALRRALYTLVEEPSSIPDFVHTPAYVLLVTDGDPSCKYGGVDGTEATYQALDALLDAGVPTYVIGYAFRGLGGLGGWFGGNNSGSSQTLVEMAQHGGTGDYYTADTEDELVTALREITGEVVSCDYQLAEEPPRGDEYIQVTLDGIGVAPGPDGWTRDGTTLRLSGATCDALRDGTAHSLSITVECEPVLIQ